MKHGELPQRHRPTAVRQALRRAELLRYWWEYRGRLGEFLRILDPSGAVRLTTSERTAVRDYWEPLGLGRVNSEWYRLFKVLNGVVNPRFVPEEMFRTRIEPVLCRRDVASAYHDKNEMDRLFAAMARPRTVLRNIYGGYYDEHYEPIARGDVVPFLAKRPGRHFLKPSISGTGSGSNVAAVQFSANGFHIADAALTLDEIERIYVQDFLLQEAVEQHESMARLHAGSLNTLRVISLRLNGTIEPIAVTLRMGNGSHVDNGHAGGLLCGVDVKTGTTTAYAMDVYFRRFATHPLSGVAFDARPIHRFDAVTAMAVSVHQQLRYFDMVSCDIALGADGAPCLVEVNTFGQGVEPHQVLKGGPLFGDRTDEVLALVSARAKGGWNQ